MLTNYAIRQLYFGSLIFLLGTERLLVLIDSTLSQTEELAMPEELASTFGKIL